VSAGLVFLLAKDLPGFFPLFLAVFERLGLFQNLFFSVNLLPPDLVARWPSPFVIHPFSTGFSPFF